MKLKRFILLSYILIAPSLMSAQNIFFYSTIKLVDGSELHVPIVENVEGKYIKIKIFDTEEAIIDYKNIVSIQHKNYAYHSNFKHPKKFYSEGSMSFLFGRTPQNSSSRVGLAFGASGNYWLSSTFSVGIGVEPTAVFININGGNIFIPVYVHLKGTIINRRVTPVYILDLGQTISINTPKEETSMLHVDGGWFARPSLGLQLHKFTILLGYQVQKITTTRTSNWWSTNQITVEERIIKNISLGTRLHF